MPDPGTEGKANASLIPDPAVKLRARARSSPAAPPAPRLVSFFRRGFAPNPTRTLRGDPECPTPRPRDALVRVLACDRGSDAEGGRFPASPRGGFMARSSTDTTKARGNARPAGPEWSFGAPRGPAWGSGRSPVQRKPSQAGCDRRSNAARRTPRQGSCFRSAAPSWLGATREQAGGRPDHPGGGDRRSNNARWDAPPENLVSALQFG